MLFPLLLFLHTLETLRLSETWDQRRVTGFINWVDSGWKGILQLDRSKLDRRTFDSHVAYQFVTQGFQPRWLDPGNLSYLVSYCTMVAGLGGQ